MSNISLIEFKNTQNIDESKIVCNDCKTNNKRDSYNKQFFKCLTCGNDLCFLYKTIHNKAHKMIDYDKRNYICNIHNDLFISYCKQCKIKLCILCEKEHKYNTHIIKYYKDLIINKNEIEKNIAIFGEKVEKINSLINDIIEILKKLKALFKNIIKYNIFK